MVGGRGELGQTAIEYVGVLVVVVAIVAGLAALAPAVGGSLAGAVTRVIGASGDEGVARDRTRGSRAAASPARGRPASRADRQRLATGASRLRRSARVGSGLARQPKSAHAGPPAIIGPILRGACRVLCKAFKKPPKVKPTARPKPLSVLARPFIGQRRRVVSDLDRRSAGEVRGRGRILRTRLPPREAAYATFFRLTRGPGVRRVAKTDRLWAVDLPEGLRVTLRNPTASSSRDWTVDVVVKATRVEKHYKMRRP